MKRRVVLRPGVVLGVFATLVSLIGGYYMTVKLGITFGDALSRVMNAYYIFYRGTPHLAAVGFVWNPLPSLLEMPFTLAHKLWQPLVTNGMAGVIVSAIFTGIGVYHLDRILHGFECNQATRWVWGFLYALNPMILLYGANGMSDGMLIGSLLGCLSGVLAYLRTWNLSELGRGSIWLAVAFLIRYEAIPFAVFLSLGVAVGMLRKRRRFSEIEGSVLLLNVPIVYSVFAWMFFNWMIMKNPLYFIVSPYGNASQIDTGTYQTQDTVVTQHHLLNSLAAVFHASTLFPPVLYALLLVLVMTASSRDSQGLTLIFATLAVPVFQAIMLDLNKTANWGRFYIEYIPMGFMLLAYLYNKLHKRLKLPAFALITVFIAYGNYGTWLTMNSPTLGRGDVPYIKQQITLNQSGTTLDFQSIAYYINSHPNLVVLMDTFTAYGVVAYIKNPEQTVITSDEDFMSVVQNPVGRVNAILVPSLQFVGRLDAINQQYPNLYSGKVSWAKLIKEFPGENQFRLYEITGSTP